MPWASGASCVSRLLHVVREALAVASVCVCVCVCICLQLLRLHPATETFTAKQNKSHSSCVVSPEHTNHQVNFETCYATSTNVFFHHIFAVDPCYIFVRFLALHQHYQVQYCFATSPLIYNIEGHP